MAARLPSAPKPDTEAPDLSAEPYRFDRTVYRFDAIGYLDDEVQDVYVFDLESGDATRLTDDRRNNSNLRWSPDGGRILYDASMRVDAARAMTPDLMSVDLAGSSDGAFDRLGQHRQCQLHARRHENRLHRASQ